MDTSCQVTLSVTWQNSLTTLSFHKKDLRHTASPIPLDPSYYHVAWYDIKPWTVFSTIDNYHSTVKSESAIIKRANHHHHHHLYVLCMGCNRAYYLNPDNHPLGPIINTAKGKIASAEINVNKALQTGKDQMRTFQTGCSETFYSKISRGMKICTSHQKKLLIGDTPLFDQEAIYVGWLGYWSAIGPLTSVSYLPMNCLHIHHQRLILQGTWDWLNQNMHWGNPFKLRYQCEPSNQMSQSLMAQLCFGP